MFKFIYGFLIYISFLIKSVHNHTTYGEENTIYITFEVNYKFEEDFFYKEVILPAHSQKKLFINLTNVEKDFYYGVIQAHSFLYNITLSQRPQIHTPHEEKYHNGTNVGLIFFNNNSISYIENLNNIEVKAAIIAILYGINSSIPGGCSKNLKVPYLDIHYNKDIIEVITPEAAESKSEIRNQSLCRLHNNFKYQPYYLYLKKNDLSSETYFAGIKKMVIISSIKKNGINVKLSAPESDFRTIYIATPGTGIVFNTVVRNSEGFTAAYVPAISYSCNPIFWQNDCHLFSDSVGKLISSLLIIFGIIKAFICCVEGSVIDLFINCIPLWAYALYRIFINFPNMSEDTKIKIIIACSITLSIITCVVTFYFGLSEVFAIITKIMFGLVFAVYVMFFLSKLSIFALKTVYWTCFTIISLFFLLTIIPICRIASLLLSIIMGIVTISTGAQLHFKSNLLLIPLAHFRHITNSDYGYANGEIVLDTIDYIILSLTIVCIISVITFQKYKFLSCNEIEDENTGYIIDERAPLITRWTSGSDDVFETPNTNYRFFRKLSIDRKKRNNNFHP